MQDERFFCFFYFSCLQKTRLFGIRKLEIKIYTILKMKKLVFASDTHESRKCESLSGMEKKVICLLFILGIGYG